MRSSPAPDIFIPAQVIERPGFVIKIYPFCDMAELIIRENALLDESMARESKLLLESACPDKKYFLLVSSEGFFRITKKARRLGADGAFSKHLSVVACYTGNSTLSLLGELYNKINKPATPTKVFSNREAAIEWLIEQMPLGGVSMN